MILTRGNLVFDTETGALRAKRVGRLTPAPARLLETLMRAVGVVSRVRLTDAIWRGRPDGPNEEMVCVYVCRVRPVLAEIGADVRIETHPGRGYSLEPPGDPRAVCHVPAGLWREAVALARLHDPGLAAQLEQVQG